jgi:hypothetical protein
MGTQNSLLVDVDIEKLKRGTRVSNMGSEIIYLDGAYFHRSLALIQFRGKASTKAIYTYSGAIGLWRRDFQPRRYISIGFVRKTFKLSRTHFSSSPGRRVLEFQGVLGTSAR